MDKCLLLKYIANELDSADREAVEQWIMSDEKNAKEYNELLANHVFENLPNIPKLDISDKALAKHNLFSKINIAAAIIIIAITIANILYFDIQTSKQKETEALANNSIKECSFERQNPTTIEYISNPGVKSKIILPDSSTVWLNGGSKLICNREFDSTARIVKLEGEGYFKVLSNSKWPMIIHTSNGPTAKITGTEFNLSAYTDDAEVTLTLYTGHIALINNNKLINLKENEEAIFNKSTNKFNIVQDKAKNNIAKAWKDGMLIFDATPMNVVTKRIERWYGVNILVNDPEINKLDITGTFSTESLSRLLEILKISSGISYSITNNEVSLFFAK